MSELRTQIRQRTFLKGRINFNNGNASIDCVVRDMSESGARLALSHTLTLPETFDLTILGKNQTRRVKLCWRQNDSVGITFLDAAEAAPAPPPTLAALQQRIRQLEDENQTLRRLLSEALTTAAAS
ncbi:PilZ domain-containing protein [Methylobacterium oryzihabitans]|uniref:PilZ domain-containing protein n=1 Tax=Methylobacterium oryzihabitans TaxID=2499852 RepID=A0A3S2WGN2_9HYPH|nr:PilZ domain-containing protein [Methylobacterium oryzihabitans]RVU21822.1 PilZ domain-containing protein [Methylobacterium oryzihabitans]